MRQNCEVGICLRHSCQVMPRNYSVAVGHRCLFPRRGGTSVVSIYRGRSAIAVPLDQVYHPHKNGTAVGFKMASIEFGTGDPLDAGSALVERLNAAFLRRWEVGFEEFERQSADAATNTPVRIAHVKVDNVGREVVVARIRCGCERHVAVSTSQRVARHRSF